MLAALTASVAPAGSAAPSALTRLSAGVALGALGGAVLGIVARVWMRVISDDPGFSWSGSIFIVAAFAVFGAAQGVAYAARRTGWRRLAVTACRVVGAVGMVGPLGGPGAVMAPTVLLGGFALARTDWSVVVRVVLAVLAAVALVAFGIALAVDLGWSVRTPVGIVGVLGVYGSVVAAAGTATLAPFPRRTVCLI